MTPHFVVVDPPLRGSWPKKSLLLPDKPLSQQVSLAALKQGGEHGRTHARDESART